MLLLALFTILSDRGRVHTGASFRYLLHHAALVLHRLHGSCGLQLDTGHWKVHMMLPHALFLSRQTVGRALILLAAATSPGQAQELLDPTVPKASPPPEVVAFVKRLASCNHWAGEEATDPERGAAISQARFRLRCNTIQQDEDRLRARFAKSPSALEALDNAGSSDD